MPSVNDNDCGIDKTVSCWTFLLVALFLVVNVDLVAALSELCKFLLVCSELLFFFN